MMNKKPETLSKARRAAKAFLGICNPRTWGPLVETYEATKFDFAFDVTWSQCGEDLGLFFSLRHIENGSYVDVGAHHPSRFSVTRKLSNSGWTAVNIEANPELIDAFKVDRPRDTNLWACVGTKEEYLLTIFEEPALSTVNDEWKTKFQSEKQRIRSEVLVPGVTLKSVFSKYFGSGFPDLLCIDAEGSDLDVLLSAKLTKGIGPKWLLLEANPPYSNVINTPAVKLALDLGYEIHLILGASTLLVRNS